MDGQTARERLLTQGLELVHARGFAATGVGDIAAVSGVPKGSFYNHFASKEAFGLAILDRYHAGLEAMLAGALADRTHAPRERLARYLDQLVASVDPARGCLLGNFALEASALSEPIRLHLARLFRQWSALLAVGLSEAPVAGPLPAPALAEVVLNGWQGAVLRAKVERSRRPLEQFRELLVATLLP